MSPPLTGRSAVVTGASRGIGLATTRALADAGARVAMLARDAAALSARATEIGEAALPLPCDVTARDSVTRVTAQIVNAFGGAPDILVNNAGVFALARLDETAPAMFAETVQVNLIAPFLFVRSFLPEMRARAHGHVVTLGSVSDRMPFPENGAYAASKYGVRAMHEVMRAELRGSGVRATLVSPGPTDTSVWDAIDLDARPGFTPCAGMLRPEVVADAIVYASTRPPEVNIDELRLSPS